MKKTFLTLLTLAVILTSATVTRADDLADLQGKWTAKRKNANGEAYTQVLEIKKNKFTYKVMGDGDSTIFVAEGDVDLKQVGPFKSANFTNIKAGKSSSELEDVSEERSVVYIFSDGVLTVASNFDKERNEKPSLDIYKK